MTASKAKTMAHERFAACETPEQIEQVFQELIEDDGWAHWRSIRSAGNARTYEIAPSAEWGHVLPRRLDKGTGCSQRWQVGSELYRTGTWGNGAGYRWVAADRDKWFEARFREAGVPVEQILGAVEWVSEGYAWRCLRALWGGGR